MDRIDQWLVSLNSPSGAVLVMHARKRVSQYLDNTSREPSATVDLDTLGKITRWCAGAEKAKPSAI